MNKQRLLKLVDLLEADAKNKKGVKFDLATWCNRPQFIAQTELPELNCNTTACAMGLAVLSGAFKRAGLTHVVKARFDGLYVIVPEFKGKTEFEAAAALFDINRLEAAGLFSSLSYSGVVVGARGERKVARKIRNFVKTGEL